MSLKRDILYKYGPKFLYNSRLYHLFRTRYSGIGHILMLHRVVPTERQSHLDANRMMEISPDFLRQSIQFYLSEGYDIISIDEVYERLNNNRSSKRFVCYTFDDGYKDTLENALPVFKEFDAPFTLYLTSGMPDGTLILWWQILDDLLLSMNHIEIKYEKIEMEFRLVSKSDKEHAFFQISDLIHRFHNGHSDSVIKEILSPYISDFSEVTKRNSLSWNDVGSLLEYDKFTLGAHSVNHYSFRQLVENMVIDETIGSIDRIFDKTGIKPEHFAYPYGSRSFVGERESKLLSALKLKTAVTSRQGSIFPEHKDYPMLLPRFHVYSYNTDRTDLFKLFGSGSIAALANKFQKFITL